MSSPAPKLHLWYEGQDVGTLSISSDRKMLCFEYSKSWLSSPESFEISHQLPLERVVFEDAAHAFFSNLLPEGKLRTMIAKRLGVSEENDHALLASFGEDCAGAFQISANSLGPQRATSYPITLEELEASFKKAANPPLDFLIRGKARLSLAGAQDKLAVTYSDGKLALPRGLTASTHILKFPSKELPFMIENEFETLSFAQNCGLPIMPFEILEKGNFKVLLIERYDRATQNGKTSRVHQEDFCQALGVLPKEKYQDEGGPSFQSCFKLLESRSSNLPEDLEILINWLVFNVAVGNCDHHAKNISLIMEEPHNWVLSPAYDLLCTKVYPDLTTKQAMSIGGSFDGGNLSRRNWDILAREINYSSSALIRLVEETCDLLEETLEIRRTEVARNPRSPSAQWMNSYFKAIKTQIRRTRLSVKASS